MEGRGCYQHPFKLPLSPMGEGHRGHGKEAGAHHAPCPLLSGQFLHIHDVKQTRRDAGPQGCGVAGSVAPC